jgi:predicted MFS family arabinose efflux permease
MVRAYRALVAHPGVPALLGAGFLARLPIATYGIGLLVLVRHGYGSYTPAGAVVGVFGAAAVVGGPVAGRWYDRYGQARVLPVATALHAVALLAVVGLARSGAAVPVLVSAAAALGLVVPQIGVLVRARWTAVLGGSDRLRTALFLEGAIDELTFVVGPLLVAGLGQVLGPAWALVAGAAIASAGALALASQRATQPAPVAAGPGRRRTVPAWRGRRFHALCGAFVALGGVFACVQVGVLAATRESGAGWAAGPVLAVFAGISLLAGLAGGAVAGPAAPVRRYRGMLAVLSAGMLLPALAAPRPVGLALLLGLAACAASPAVATGYAVAGRAVPAAHLTEGLGYVTAGLNLGLAAGTVLAGAVADLAGGRAVFATGAALGAAGVLAALAVTGQRHDPDTTARVVDRAAVGSPDAAAARPPDGAAVGSPDAAAARPPDGAAVGAAYGPGRPIDR